MPNPHADGRNRRRDSETGLTRKQSEALPILANSATLRAGVVRCVELGIITDVTYFYSHWWKEDVFVAAVDAARREVFGQLRARSLAKLQAFHDDALNAVIAGALRSGPQQIQFLRLYFEIEGTVSGQPLLPRATANLNVGIIGGDAGRMTLPARLAKLAEERESLLRLTRSVPAEVVVEPSKRNGGSQNGDSD